MKMLMSLFLSLALLCPDAYAQQVNESEENLSASNVDLTEIIVVALTLRFVFGISQTFIRKSD